MFVADNLAAQGTPCSRAKTPSALRGVARVAMLPRARCPNHVHIMIIIQQKLCVSSYAYLVGARSPCGRVADWLQPCVRALWRAGEEEAPSFSARVRYRF